MKIISMEIYKKSKKVREINFKEDEVNYIFGNVEKENNDKETINSLGKTLVLHFLDYILGCNCKPELKNKKYFSDVYITSSVKKDNGKEIFKIERSISTGSVLVNNEKMQLSKYKIFFNLERQQFLSNFILLKAKTNLLGSNDNSKNITQDTIINFFKIINLNELAQNLEELKNKYSERKNNKTIYNKELKNQQEKSNNIEEKLESNKNNFIMLSEEVNEIESNLKNVNFKEDIKEYEEKLIDLNELARTYESEIYILNEHKKHIEEYKHDYSEFNISKKEIEKIILQTSFELPQMQQILKQIEEVEEFHKSVLLERNQSLEKELKIISSKLEKFNTKLIALNEEIIKRRKILKDDNAYKNSLNLLLDKKEQQFEIKNEVNKYEELLELKIKNDSYEPTIDKLENNIFKLVNSEIYASTIKEINKKITEIIESLYAEKREPIFAIEKNEVKNTEKLFNIVFTLKGDSSGGIEAVKYNIIDYIKVLYGKPSILIQDSACFNGIDSRQVRNIIIHVLGNICKSQTTQIFVSMNKFQLFDENELKATTNMKDDIAYIEKEAVLVLSENEKLFYEDF